MEDLSSLLEQGLKGLRSGHHEEYNILKDLHGDTANELLGLINEG